MWERSHLADRIGPVDRRISGPELLDRMLGDATLVLQAHGRRSAVSEQSVSFLSPDRPNG
jgi:hypothetical protein